MASPISGDVNVSNIIALGSLSINLGDAPEPIRPRLPQLPMEKVIVDGELDLFLALRWDYNSETTFVGRNEELERILTWAESESKDIELRLVSGAAGVGKTRLAAEAAKILRTKGWSAGFLPRHTTQIDIVAHEDKGLLLIVDYLEERLELIESLCEKVSDIGETPLPIRVLFLSRGSFDNLPKVFRLLGHRIGRQELATLGTLKVADCVELAKSIAQGLSSVLGREPPGDSSVIEEWLGHDKRHQTALLAQSVGIASVVFRDDIGNFNAAGLIDKIVERECLKISRAEKRLRLPEKSISTCVALSTFTDELLTSSVVERVLKDTFGDGINLSAISETGWWVAKENYRSSGIGRQEPDLFAASLVFKYFNNTSKEGLRAAFSALAEEAHQDFLEQYDRVLFDVCFFPKGAEAAAYAHQQVHSVIADSLWRYETERVLPRSHQRNHWSRDITSRLAKQTLKTELAVNLKQSRRPSTSHQNTEDFKEGQISDAMDVVRQQGSEVDQRLITDALSILSNSEATAGSLDIAIEAAGVAFNNSLANWNTDQAMGHPRRCLTLGGLLAQRYDASKDDAKQALTILGEAMKLSQSMAFLGFSDELVIGAGAAFEMAEMLQRGGYEDAARQCYRETIRLAESSFPSPLVLDLDDFLVFDETGPKDFEEYDEAYWKFTDLSGIERAQLVKDDTKASEFAQTMIRKAISHYKLGEFEDALMCRRASDGVFKRLVDKDKFAHFLERYRFLRQQINILEELNRPVELDEFFADFVNDEHSNQLVGIHRPLFLLSGWLVVARRALSSEDFETAKEIGLAGVAAFEAQPQMLSEVVWALDVAVECHCILANVASWESDVGSQIEHVELALSLLSDSCKIDGTGSFYKNRLQSLRALNTQLTELYSKQGLKITEERGYPVAFAEAVWSQMLENNESNIPWVNPPWSQDFELTSDTWWTRLLRKIGW